MKKNRIGVIIVLVLFALFYIVTTTLLDKRNISKDVPPVEEEKQEVADHEEEKEIVNNLYQNVRMLYEVVNNKFKVNVDDTYTDEDIIYKRITNFDEVVTPYFTSNGVNKYITDLSSYFYVTEDGYYLAGNLVTYQTNYFRGNMTEVFILEANSTRIDAIVYEKMTSGSKNTLATVKVVNDNSKWLIDEINILSSAN